MPTHQYTVAMTCEGCANAVRRNLGKLEGFSNLSRKIALRIEKVDISVADKKVLVTGSAPQDDIFTAIKKTGKDCSYVGSQ